VVTDRPRQGEVWWGESEDKRRPMLVISRSSASAHLNRIVVAPVTRSVRGIPTEIPIGPEVGLPAAGVATLDNLLAWPISMLTERVGVIEMPHTRICEALAAVADC
jgi:mRNA interferase MazF